MPPPTDLVKEGKIAFDMLDECLGRRRRPPPTPPPRNAAPKREPVIGGHHLAEGRTAIVTESYSSVINFRWANSGVRFP